MKSKAVLTGDIIGSRKAKNTELWQEALLSAMKDLNPEANRSNLFRGDSFQLWVDSPLCFRACLYIQSCLKARADISARIAIGIGHLDNGYRSINSATGSAAERSGGSFESLKSKDTALTIDTGNIESNASLSLLFRFASLSIQNWTQVSAEAVKLVMEHPDKSQRELAGFMGIKQHSVSSRLKRAHWHLLSDLDQYVQHYISKNENLWNY